MHNLFSAIHHVNLPEAFTSKYAPDSTVRNIYRVLVEEKLMEQIKQDRAIRMVQYTWIKDSVSYYVSGVCVSRCHIKNVLHLAHDNRIAGHFGYAKTLARLVTYQLKNKYLDVYQYCRGCRICQQSKDCRTKPLGEPQPLELPDRRWGCVLMNSETHLPTTEKGFDCITTFADRFTKRVHLIPSRGTASAVEVAKCFFDNIFKHHGPPASIVSNRDPKFISKFWSHLM